ncbi:MAG: MFS transporter [Candidatus Pacearchaeota archaeon]|nr:MFS transporter [Candidatus Pacearchaeota archaeon]
MSFFKKNELKYLWPFYIDALISPMLFFAPAFYVIYLLGLDFSVFQIGILFTVSFLVAFVFEIPTGSIADLYGRKTSVLFGYFIESVGFLSLFFISNYYYFLFAFALIGFGSTFSSGAKEAWIVDLVKKRKGLSNEYFTKSQSFDATGLVISGILGAFIVSVFGLSLIWMFAFVSFLISISVLSFAKEDYVRKKSSFRDSYKRVKKQTGISLRFGAKHPVLFWFFIAGFTLAFAITFNEGIAWTPFLEGLGFPDYAFGYLWSAIAVVYAVSPWVSKKLLKVHSEKNQRNFISGAILIAALTTILVLFANSLSFVLFISIFTLFAYSSIGPVERSYFHRFIPSKMRATIGSVEGMILSLGVILATPLVGLFVDVIGARYTIFLGGVLLFPAAIIYYRIKDFEKKEHLKIGREEKVSEEVGS